MKERMQGLLQFTELIRRKFALRLILSTRMRTFTLKIIAIVIEADIMSVSGREIEKGANDTIIGNMEGGRSIRVGEKEIGAFTVTVQGREGTGVTSATDTAKNTIIKAARPELP